LHKPGSSPGENQFKMSIQQTQMICCLTQLVMMIFGLHYGIKYCRQHGYFGLAREYAAHLPSNLHKLPGQVLEKEHQLVASARQLE